jgi:hypothetical protein
VAGRSTVGRNEDATSSQILESNITPSIAEEPWKTLSRGYKQSPSVNHTLYYKIPVIINRYGLLSNRGNYEGMVWDSRNTHELEKN